MSCVIGLIDFLCLPWCMCVGGDVVKVLYNCQGNGSVDDLMQKGGLLSQSDNKRLNLTSFC